MPAAMTLAVSAAWADSPPATGHASSGAAGSSVRIGLRAYGDRPTVTAMAELGALIFRDRGLSASGHLACASCHDPAHAFGPPDALPAAFGGADGLQQGTRAAPSLMYLQTTIPFTEHFVDDEDGHGVDAGPTGGLTWDGRAGSPHEQALIPLFAVNEMANRDPAALAARVKKAAYAPAFAAAFSAPGQNVFDDPQQVVAWLAMALEVYQQSPEVFYPFTSKYDAAMRHRARLSPQELHGLALFNDPAKGNCASCHPSGMRSDGGLPLFTDAGHVATGVPRNPQLAANRDPAYFDLGLCGPQRMDLSARPELCGRFKAPSLRNVALRQTFFHNGAMHRLSDVLAFYVDRDIHPERWFPRTASGEVMKFDDLPAAYRANVNGEVPFAPLPGGQPRLDAAEIDDVIAFLKTLTDGFVPEPPAATTAQR